MNNLNFYSGENSVLDFLNPGKSRPLPLVEIPRCLNPFIDDGIHIYAKLMNMTPLGNVKSLPALNMLQYLKSEQEIHTLIENSSGNTVFSLAVIARLLGINHTKAYVSHEVSLGKLQLLRLLGTEPIVNEEPICPDPADKESGIYKAKQKGKQRGWFNPGQYDNHLNPQAHYKWTGPQIWKQTKGNVDVFCTGLGTTGTMMGTGGYLKEKNPEIKNIGVVRQPNNPVPGVRTPNLLRQIAFDWSRVVDNTEEVGTVDSFKLSLQMCRHGLLVGPSSGFALKGLLQYLKKSKLKNVNCVFICADSPLPYLNEYFEYLDESDFPKIENESLLINKLNISSKEIKSNNKFEIDIKTAISRLNERQEAILIDVRTPQEFRDHHAPGAINIDHETVLQKIEAISKKYQNNEVYLICRSGNRSSLVTEALRGKNIKAYNIKGGMMKWSKLNLPRIQPKFCKK